MKFIKLAKTGIIAFSVATVIAQVILLTVLWQKGTLTEKKRFRMSCVMYDIDVKSVHDQMESNQKLQSQSLLPEMRIVKATDLAARSESLGHSLGELVALENEIKKEYQRNGLRKIDFDNLLKKLESEAIASSLLKTRQTLESMKTKQAKTQILRMLADDARGDVVAMVKEMPLDKRKKIFSEFKSPQEAEVLHDILRELREVTDVAANQEGGNAR